MGSAPGRRRRQASARGHRGLSGPGPRRPAVSARTGTRSPRSPQASAWLGRVIGAVVEYGTPRVDDPQRLAGVSALGVDETIPGRQAKHHTQFVTAWST